MELAYKLVFQYNLAGKYSYQLLFKLLIGKIEPQSFALARRIILDHFPVKFRNRTLEYLASICQTHSALSRVLKDIVLRDFKQFSFEDSNVLKNSFLGIVTTYNKGNYTIRFSASNEAVTVKKDYKHNYKIDSIIQFRITDLGQKVSESRIVIEKTELFRKLFWNYFFDQFYIGQIVKLQVYVIERSKVILINGESDDLQFILPIREISYMYIKDIKDFVTIGQVLNLRIINFHRANRLIFCSQKELHPDKKTRSIKK
ncbi:hypothetical protein [Dyadobacter sp. NIV53]|uniref:hypothetical protein n=1 Tax=Dyadobacter sp. NIV53 TaxID=2861765 RepID=UPI001C8872EB|nr:hypothetical protein [Dyadobacter sp. NIV53]